MYIQIAHRIKFHIYSWRENLFARLIQREDGKRWMLGFFNGHSFFFIKLNLIFTLVIRCSLFVLKYYLFFLSINVSLLSHNSYLHLSLFCRERFISVSHPWFYQSHDQNTCHDTFRRWAVKGIDLETIFSRFINWNVLQWAFDGRGIFVASKKS